MTDDLRTQIDQALLEGGDLLDFDQMVALAQDRRVQLWGDEEAAIATEVLAYPKGKILHAFMAAGRLRKIVKLQPQVTEFARAEGCRAILCYGRPGWGRVGVARGWRLQSYCYVLPLEGEEAA